MFEWILGVVSRAGLLGVAVLMLLENVAPPIPSELVMPLAGFEAARGRLSFAGVVIAGTMGSLAGAVFWYEIGRGLGHERLAKWASRHGRWIGMSTRDVETASNWFERHGGWAVLAGRLAPGVRTMISVPAGVARMPWPTFLAFTLVGTAIWTAFLAGCGYVLSSNYDRVERWMDPITYTVLALVAGLYLYRVLTWKGS